MAVFQFRALAVTALLVVAASCSDNSVPPPRAYPLGERVHLGRLIYTAFETQWLPQLGEGAAARVPQHRFFLVRLSITNGSSQEVVAPSLSLLDDKGQTISELSNGEGVPQYIGFLRQIQPANSAQGNVVFDVPPQHYKLRIADEDEKFSALIDIPLSFGVDVSAEPPPSAEPLMPENTKKK